MLQAAASAAQQSRRKQIDGAIVLAAIVGDGKSPAAGLLKALGMTFEEAIRALQRANTKARLKPLAKAASVSGEAPASRGGPGPGRRRPSLGRVPLPEPVGRRPRHRAGIDNPAAAGDTVGRRDPRGGAGSHPEALGSHGLRTQPAILREARPAPL